MDIFPTKTHSCASRRPLLPPWSRITFMMDDGCAFLGFWLKEESHTPGLGVRKSWDELSFG